MVKNFPDFKQRLKKIVHIIKLTVQETNKMHLYIL